MMRGGGFRLALLSSLIVFAYPAIAGDVELDVAESIESQKIPVVLSPTRLRQSLADVPASVTVITQEMMRRYGIDSIAEALRLVPGMGVSQVSGSDYRVNYHGGNILVPRQMDVLIDGVSVYRPALARVDWKELPVVLDNIDRIEVTRGPAAASYGANAMTAVVNIITKNPESVQGVLIAGAIGSRGERSITTRQSGDLGESTRYSVTVARQSDKGFDVAQGVTNNDGIAMNRLNVYSTTKLGSAESVDVSAAVLQSKKEATYADAYQRTLPNLQDHDYYLSTTWKKAISPSHEVRAQAYASLHQRTQEWTTCPPAAMFLPELYTLWRQNSAYANAILAGKRPSGGTAEDNSLAARTLAAVAALGKGALTPRCVYTNQNYTERRANVEIQDTRLISDTLRFVTGMRVRQDVGDSQTYLNGDVSNSSVSVFSNVEYKPAIWAAVNVGGYLERDKLTGIGFSPRVALLLRQSEHNTLRLVASDGTRMPDIQEQQANWSYRATDAVPMGRADANLVFFQNAHAPGTLIPERIQAYELGYFGNFPEVGFRIDGKIFVEDLSRLISEKLQVSSFMPTNESSLRRKGFELQANYEPSSAWAVYGTLSRIIYDDVSNPLAATQYAPLSGVLGLTHNFRNKWSASIVTYKSHNDGPGESDFARNDLILRKNFKLSQGAQLALTLKASRLADPTTTYYKDVGRVASASYAKKTSLAASANISF
jgi:iron complex outermembrane receptor protein